MIFLDGNLNGNNHKNRVDESNEWGNEAHKYEFVTDRLQQIDQLFAERFGTDTCMKCIYTLVITPINSQLK